MEEERTQKLEELRAAIQKGKDDIEAGRYTTMSTLEEMNDLFDEIIEKSNEKLKNDRTRKKSLADFLLNSPLKNTDIDLSRLNAVDSRKVLEFEKEYDEPL